MNAPVITPMKLGGYCAELPYPRPAVRGYGDTPDQARADFNRVAAIYRRALCA